MCLCVVYIVFVLCLCCVCCVLVLCIDVGVVCWCCVLCEGMVCVVCVYVCVRACVYPCVCVFWSDLKYDGKYATHMALSFFARMWDSVYIIYSIIFNIMGILTDELLPCIYRPDLFFVFVFFVVFLGGVFFSFYLLLQCLHTYNTFLWPLYSKQMDVVSNRTCATQLKQVLPTIRSNGAVV